MKGSVIFRLACITALFILCCGFLIDRMIKTGTPLNLRTLFPFVAAGIIIFVPLYKKYVKNTQGNNGSGKGK